MKLSDIFSGIAYKRLVLVDLPNKGSHQHELNGSLILGRVLGYEKIKRSIKWMRFSDANEVISQNGDFTWYDAREKSSARTGRSEWRFYYSGNFLSSSRIGDTLIIAKLKDGAILGLLFANHSKWLAEVEKIGISENHGSTLQALGQSELEKVEISSDSPLLQSLGLVIASKNNNILKVESVPVGQPIAPSNIQANPDDIFKIRPAGRHILTIGRDLIQDRYTAIVELVKNAYDADSPDVNIEFKASANRGLFSICIEDHGHGMSRDVVINRWMVPSTDDKQKRKISPAGRTMQGRKGVGRYAASILGNNLLLETVTENGEKTTVYVEWQSFESAQYLDDVEILIETTKSSESSGTRLTITGDVKLAEEWDKPQLNKLKDELKKLIPPINADEPQDQSADKFQIIVCVVAFFENQGEVIRETIEPYPIFNLFDYRIAGHVDADGTGLLKYSSQKARNTVEEEVQLNFGSPTDCGGLNFDIRVYDREKESIESLIGRGLKDESGNYFGNLQARQLLNEYNGIGVYRHGFRIRPLGDPDFDWLKLNEQRVQNPSLRIGSNQVIGFVKIQSEEKSGLIEKSARDGLKENWAFHKLKEITNKIIIQLEDRRFNYRKKAGLSRPVLKVEKELERLFAFDELKRGVRAKLTKGGIDKKSADEIINIISKEEEEKNKIADEIRQTVAVYQGQATLGKIINVILHEGRRPLNYFKNQIPNLNYLYDLLKKSDDPDVSKRFISIAEGVGQNADFFVKLFSRLDPLAAGKRFDKILLPLKKTIENALTVFERDLKEHNISLNINGPDGFKFLSWPQDIYAIITNLADNSIYWMREKKSKNREINILIETKGDALEYIDYRDTGPGIEPRLIASEVIFEPQFSTKPDGTGLGLAIAGEAALRNGLELKAFESENGVYFRLQPKTGN